MTWKEEADSLLWGCLTVECAVRDVREGGLRIGTSRDVCLSSLTLSLHVCPFCSCFQPFWSSAYPGVTGTIKPVTTLIFI